MKNEVKLDIEWTIFDDAVVDHKGSWHAVVKQCVEQGAYPTVLFYEKLELLEYPPEIIPGSEFSEMQILDLLKLSRTYDGNFGDLNRGSSKNRIDQKAAFIKK